MKLSYKINFVQVIMQDTYFVCMHTYIQNKLRATANKYIHYINYETFCNFCIESSFIPTGVSTKNKPFIVLQSEEFIVDWKKVLFFVEQELLMLLEQQLQENASIMSDEFE